MTVDCSPKTAKVAKVGPDRHGLLVRQSARHGQSPTHTFVLSVFLTRQSPDKPGDPTFHVSPFRADAEDGLCPLACAPTHAGVGSVVLQVCDRHGPGAEGVA